VDPGATACRDLVYTFEPVAVAREAAAQGIETLRERVVAAVAAHVEYIDISVVSPPSSYEAFQSFQKSMVFYGSNYSDAIAHLRRALEIDPEFHVARYYLIWSYLETGDRARAEEEISVADGLLNRMTPFDQATIRSVRAWYNEDREGAANALRHMLELAPHSFDARFDLGEVTIELNRPGEAAELLEPIVSSSAPTRFSNAWWALWKMTEALHMLGDYEREFEYAELGLERFPDVGNLHYAKARALAAMGHAVEAKEVVDACLPVRLREGGLWGYNLGRVMTETAAELRAHGHRRASDDMAARAVAWLDKEASESDTEERDSDDFWLQFWALSFAGRWVEAREPLEELEKRGSNPVAVAGALGVIAARTGNHEEARQIFDELPDPGRRLTASNRSYWRAAIAANLGEKDRAVDLLAEAFSQGMSYSNVWHSDLTLEPLWDYPPFQELIEPKG
jgi:tetratricopeptide (TPR) repeat protein